MSAVEDSVPVNGLVGWGAALLRAWRIRRRAYRAESMATATPGEPTSPRPSRALPPRTTPGSARNEASGLGCRFSMRAKGAAPDGLGPLYTTRGRQHRSTSDHLNAVAVSRAENNAPRSSAEEGLHVATKGLPHDELISSRAVLAQAQRFQFHEVIKSSCGSD